MGSKQIKIEAWFELNIKSLGSKIWAHFTSEENNHSVNRIFQKSILPQKNSFVHLHNIINLSPSHFIPYDVQITVKKCEIIQNKVFNYFPPVWLFSVAFLENDFATTFFNL